MDPRLHFLESFTAEGSDGGRYHVRGYERMAPEAPMTHALGNWESTGVAEYHLDDGRFVDMKADGSMRIANTEVQLRRVADDPAAGRR